MYGRQQPQADLTAENCDYMLLRRLHEEGQFEDTWDLSLEELHDKIVQGELYGLSSRLQDDVVGECLGMGFKSVRISDNIPGGGYSDSVIFGDPDDLQIIEKIA